MTTQDIIRELCAKKSINISNLEKDLGFSNGSLKGNGAIKSDRLLAVAKYFNVSMEYLMGSDSIEYDEETKTWNKTDEEYYFDDDAKEYAQFLFEHPDHRALFDASRKVKKEDLQKAIRAIGLFTEE